jgi:hypothetical protein
MKNPRITEKEMKELEKLKCCPMCNDRLVRLEYVGTDRPPEDISYMNSSDWKNI